jgi:hypothetical protein
MKPFRQRLRNSSRWFRLEQLLSSIALVTILMILPGSPGNTQPCNPAIDGTYCATQTRRSPTLSTPPTISAPAMSLGASLSSGPYDQPATLGAITFSGDGSRCIGLLRRVNCN